MQRLAILLNLPWTASALLLALLCVPRKVQLHRQPFAIVVTVRSMWPLERRRHHRGVRAATQGSVVILGSHLLQGDFEHELIHIQQYLRVPFLQPILYELECYRHGKGLRNKYEHEAYTKSGSTYIDH